MSSSQEQPEGGAQSVKSEVPPAAQAAAATSSCRKKKSDSDSTSFFGDIVDHIDEFVHASMDEHKSCLQKTLNKVGDLLLLSHFLNRRFYWMGEGVEKFGVRDRILDERLKGAEAYEEFRVTGERGVMFM